MCDPIRGMLGKTFPPTRSHQVTGLHITHKKKKVPYLSVCVPVDIIIPGIVVMLDKSKIFFLFSLESGWSSVCIGRKVTLGKKTQEPEVCLVNANSWNLY